jgi:hypothetical protein
MVDTSRAKPRVLQNFSGRYKNTSASTVAALSIIFLVSCILFYVYMDLASNRNEYQENLQVCKGSRCLGLTNLPYSQVDSLEIWDT